MSYGNSKIICLLNVINQELYLNHDILILILYIIKSISLYMEEWIIKRFLMIGISWIYKIINGHKYKQIYQ